MIFSVVSRCGCNIFRFIIDILVSSRGSYGKQKPNSLEWGIYSELGICESNLSKLHRSEGFEKQKKEVFCKLHFSYLQLKA